MKIFNIIIYSVSGKWCSLRASQSNIGQTDLAINQQELAMKTKHGHQIRSEKVNCNHARKTT